MNNPIIEIQNIARHFKVGTELIKALDSVDLTIFKNEFVALMGQSGSGKSTLMNILGCLDTPTNGVYSLNNQKVSDLDDDSLASIRNKEIGFVFQTFNLLPRSSALENVMLPLIYSGITKTKRIEMATEALKKVSLSDRMNHKPNELSGGQRQRVAIARALVNKPSIILADEPTGNLDEENASNLIKLLMKINKKYNQAIVITTHNPNVANIGNKKFKLEKGNLK